MIEVPVTDASISGYNRRKTSFFKGEEMATAIAKNGKADFVISNLIQHAEKIRNDSEKTIENFMPGDCAAQGDLNLVAIKSLPSKSTVRKNRQVAEGTTMGSRHIVMEGEVYDCDQDQVVAAIKKACGATIGKQYIGPVIKGPAFLTHPEHGDIRFTGDCVVAVVFQRVWDKEQRELRVKD